ncbi:MAG TPA: cell division protein FtsZ [Nitrospiraceae bacterium]|nr:cell division protein FtsZ [Nitrospiraceae bacterium]
MFEMEEVRGQGANIKVIGVGGAGGNAVNNMIASNLHGVEFIAVNTDSQILETSLAPAKVQIGMELTKGLGAGSNPDIGREAALEDREAIAESLRGADMVFITAGMGGGTGTGASSVVATIAKELGALTVAIVTKPFFYEGRKRAINADIGMKELQNNVDAIIVIPNDRISLVVEKGTPMLKSFAVANDVLRQAVQGISDLILIPGLINLDFADVKAVMVDAGRAVMGIGLGRGDGGALEAARKAISNPLLEDSSTEGAKGIILSITGRLNLSQSSVQDAAGFIYDLADNEANIIFGAVINPDIEDEVRVTVIATGFQEKKEKVDLPQVKKWNPVKELSNFKGADRVLAKSLKSDYSALPLPARCEQDIPALMPYEDPLDVPAFMRKAVQKVI